MEKNGCHLGEMIEQGSKDNHGEENDPAVKMKCEDVLHAKRC